MKASEFKAIRESKGWNKSQLARFINIDASRISSIENGSVGISNLMERVMLWIKDGGFSLDQTK